VCRNPEAGRPSGISQGGGRLVCVLKLLVVLAVIGIVLVAWLVLRGYGDGGPEI
jgi:hypothetical protein